VSWTAGSIAWTVLFLGITRLLTGIMSPAFSLHTLLVQMAIAIGGGVVLSTLRVSTSSLLSTTVAAWLGWMLSVFTVS